MMMWKVYSVWVWNGRKVEGLYCVGIEWQESGRESGVKKSGKRWKIQNIIRVCKGVWKGYGMWRRREIVEEHDEVEEL